MTTNDREWRIFVQPGYETVVKMDNHETGFQPGAHVLIDGTIVATVKAYFPEGSTSYGFPHYKVDIAEGDRNVAIAVKRIGVVRRGS